MAYLEITKKSSFFRTCNINEKIKIPRLDLAEALSHKTLHFGQQRKPILFVLAFFSIRHAKTGMPNPIQWGKEAHIGLIDLVAVSEKNSRKLSQLCFLDGPFLRRKKA